MSPKLIDLTQTLEPGIPDWEGCCGFQMSELFFETFGIRVNTLSTPAGIGTHMDAPSHFIEQGCDIASIPIDQLVAPAAVIDVRHRITKADYFIQVDDIVQFEQTHGEIPQGALVLGLTGWSQHWHNPDSYHNKHGDQRRFPGFSNEAANYLLTKNIVGIGIDTLSPDGSHESFPVHKTILGAGKFILENLCNLEKLPPLGATVMALPIKIKSGSEAPCRVIAKLD